MWRLCDVTCDIIMPGKGADSGPDMTLRTRRGCSWTPYWHQSSSRFFFLLVIYFLMLFCYLVTLCFALFCFVVLPCVLHLHRCGIIMCHNKPPYIKPGLQCCCNLQLGRQQLLSPSVVPSCCTCSISAPTWQCVLWTASYYVGQTQNRVTVTSEI